MRIIEIGDDRFWTGQMSFKRKKGRAKSIIVSSDLKEEAALF